MTIEYSAVYVSSLGKGIVPVEGFTVNETIRQTMVVGDANVSGNVAAVSDASGLYVQIINSSVQPLYTSALGGESTVTVSNFPTTQAVSGTVSIQEPLSIDDNGGSLTVDGTVAATQSGAWTASVDNFPTTQAVSGTVSIQEPLSIDDNGGSITVDGTVAATQSGAWTTTIQDGGNVISVDDAGGSLTVDGTVSVDNFPTTQAVSGTVSIQEPLSIDDNGGSITVDGTVAATQSGAWTTTIQDGGNVISVDDAGGSLTIDGSVSVDNFPTTQAVSGTVSIQEPLSIDDNGGSITVDGTVAATQSGAWTATIQDGGNVISVDDGGGSLTVDGSVSVSNLPATQAVSGTVSISQPVSIDDNGGSITVDGTVAATQSGAWTVTQSGAWTTSVDNFPTTQAVSGTVSIQEPLSIDDNGGSITVDGSVSVSNFPASQTVNGTVSIQEPLSIDDNGGSISVDDNGGSLTVDGTIAATQSGSWTTTIQDGGNVISIDDGGGSITVDGVVFPVTQNVNITDINGVTVAKNIGDSSTGTLRVVLASDQPYPYDLLSTSVSATAGTNTEIIAAPGAGNQIVVWGYNITTYGGATTRPVIITDGAITGTGIGVSNTIAYGLARSVPTNFSSDLTRGRALTANTALNITMAGTSSYVAVGVIYYTVEAV